MDVKYLNEKLSDLLRTVLMIDVIKGDQLDKEKKVEALDIINEIQKYLKECKQDEGAPFVRDTAKSLADAIADHISKKQKGE